MRTFPDSALAGRSVWLGAVVARPFGVALEAGKTELDRGLANEG